MKKLILILILSASFYSCEKSGQCYTCTFGTVNGYTPPAEEYCGPIPYVKKINGNEINTFCIPK